MKKIDINFYPGWTRKAITFSIDDGVIPMDRKFMEILRPAGIRGTFNLCSHSLINYTKEWYREFYEGQEVANHCKHHPYAFADGESYQISTEPFDAENSDHDLLHPTGTEHLYWIYKNPKGWRLIADTEGYIQFIDQGHEELEGIFGKGSVRSFAWPFTEQPNAAIHKHLSTKGYYGVRASKKRGTDGEFNLEENRMPWGMTAIHNDLLELAEVYDKLEDDGKLKFFCFGVHSKDYEIYDKWGDLQEFADTYGHRPEDYYYAPVGEIFDYADALKELIIAEEKITNPTKLDLYIRVDGKNVLIKAGTEYIL